MNVEENRRSVISLLTCVEFIGSAESDPLRHLVVRLARENPGHGGVPAGCGGGVAAVRRYALGLMPRARLNAALNANAE